MLVKAPAGGIKPFHTAPNLKSLAAKVSAWPYFWANLQKLQTNSSWTDVCLRAHTHSAGGAASVGQHGRRQLLVAGEGVRSAGRDMLLVLSGQLLQIKLHVHVLGRVAARKLHVVGQQLAFQLVLSEHRRVVQVLRHVGAQMEGQTYGRLAKLASSQRGRNGRNTGEVSSKSTG